MQVIARDKDDIDARYDRALLYAEVNEPKKAVIALDGILKGRPGEPEVGLACTTASMSEASQQIVSDRKDLLLVHTRHSSTLSQAALPCADLQKDSRDPWLMDLPKGCDSAGTNEVLHGHC